MVNVYIGPPFIRAVKSNLIVPSGANVTLACEIVNPGEPRAAFGWRKNAENVASTYSVTVNNSFVTIILTNVTTQDAGTYTCTATGIVSYYSDSIQLRVLPVDDAGIIAS